LALVACCGCEENSPAQLFPLKGRCKAAFFVEWRLCCYLVGSGSMSCFVGLKMLRRGFVFLLAFCSCSVLAQTPEFRALWVDAFHAGYKTSAQVSQLVAEARAGNFNALIVQVRKRGDTYFNSAFEPKATDIAASFDPLADLLAKAHNTAAGPRLEVHAWMVTYPIWGNSSAPPTHPSHVFNRHPEWLTKNNSEQTWNGSSYALDPGHPEVQWHIYNVAMELVSRYAIDGLHFDYIRYSGNAWGYNSAAVARFNSRFNRVGQPPATDPLWLQFRRDQVSALVRKIYLSAVALKPQIKISAATITWAPGVSTDAEWLGSAAYANVLQDWRSWMQEGILDLNIPMAYFRQPDYGPDYIEWSNFAKNRRYNRHAAIGPGIYLNSVEDAIVQMRSVRTVTSAGNRADGMARYSYAVPNAEGISRTTFFSALTQPSAYDPNPVPIFKDRVPTPVMPWKTAPTRGHLKGYVRDGRESAKYLDGATLTVNGPQSKTLLADATGFFGAVDLIPGIYALRVSFPGLETSEATVTIEAGQVATRDFLLMPSLGTLFFENILVSAGSRNAIVSWRTLSVAECWVEFEDAMGNKARTVTAGPATNHVAWLTGLDSGKLYRVWLLAQTSSNQIRSDEFLFQTAGELIIDNPEAGYSGAWTLGTTATDKYSASYHFAGTVSGNATATATFRPTIFTPGQYDVYLWHSQGSNRSTNALVEIVSDTGPAVRRINQSGNGGTWQLLASRKHFAAGTNGFVRLSNSTGESGKVVIADAVRWVYSTGQDPPVAGAVPEWWARHFFGRLVNGSEDADGDGFSAYAEFVLGTAPQDPQSRLTMRISRDQNGSIEVRFSPCHADRRYQLQRRGSFSNESWKTVNATWTRRSTGEGVFIFNETSSSGFFRLLSELSP
jgi:uncharacterized lipoprotein YddW (UPF0748 family)